MTTSTHSFNTSPTNGTLPTAFLALVPKLHRHGTIVFRHISCPATRADQISEMVALAWQWFLRLHERGKDVNGFVMVFVYLVARAVKSGRRVSGMDKARDVLNPLAQRRRGFKVESFPSLRRSHDQLYGRVSGQQEHNAFEERLCDNSRTPPPDAAAFRIDFPTFLQGLTERDRRMAEYLSLGHSATTAADKFKVTPGRVTQLRQGWCRAWKRFEDGETVRC